MIENRPWQQDPFFDLATIIDAWEMSPEMLQGSRGFATWYANQSQLPRIGPALVDRLTRAITTSDKNYASVFCCKSPSACRACPHNRAWLRGAD